MINMFDEIIFRDGVTLDRGTDEITENFMTNVGHTCDLGRFYGLTLDRFEIDDEMVYYEWRGLRKDVLEFYTYYSENMTLESEETKRATQDIIRNKPSIREG